MRRALFGFFGLVIACGSGAEEPLAGDVDGVATQLRARAGDTTVWIDPVLTRRAATDGPPFHLLTGRTSRNIEDGLAFVLDDPYGAFATVSARRFEIAFSNSELTTLAVGVQEFVRLTFAPSGGRPASLFARVVVAPRLSGSSGSGLYLDGQPTFVDVGDRPVLRLFGHADRDLIALDARAGGVEVPDVRLVDARHFTVDLSVDHVGAIAGTRAQVVLAGKGKRSTVRRSTGIDLVVTNLDVATTDPYETWPAQACEAEVTSCLEDLTPGSTDLSSCGAWLEVRACPRGAAVDDVAFVAAMDRARAGVLLTLAADARALVGAEREASFLGNVEMSAEHVLELNFGRRYPTAEARDRALDAEIERVIDGAYTRPLEHVEKVTPIPGDAARIRDLSADTLLEYLATADLTQAEWRRTVDDLTKAFRDRHLAALRELREVGTIALETPTEVIYTTNWLDAHVEVTIARTTGDVTAFLFEVD